MTCVICLEALEQPVFRSDGDFCVTSLAQPMLGKLEIYWCSECSHLQSVPVANIEQYYDESYNILGGSEDEDHLYGIVNGKKVFRAEHQLNTLLGKVDLPDGARVLDYGCGKAPVLKLLRAVRPDIVPHLFDVSDVYLPFWAKFAQPANWALYQPPTEWSNSMDLVLSFFSLEHTAKPREFVGGVARMLRPGGLFYFVIPNPYGANASDMLVCDHVNHFSEPSLRRLLAGAGFELESIDEQAHDLAYVAVARRTHQTVAPSDEAAVMAIGEQVTRLVRLWSQAPERIRAFEREHSGSSAIYGAGFCGCYISLNLKDSSRLACFIDQNPYKQRTTLMDKPIVGLDTFGKTSDVIYVGLNPARARSTIAQIEAWRDRENHYFFL